MTSHLIGENGIVLYLEETELERFGITSRPVDAEEVKTLVFRSLERRGLPAGGEWKIEVYGGGDLIIFARAGRRCEREVFAFERAEDLLAAIEGLRSYPRRSSLFYHAPRYYLEVRGQKPELGRCAARFTEFGERTSPSSEYLREHGQVIAERDAVNRIGAALLGGRASPDE